MEVIQSVLLLVAYFAVPFLVGNIYSAVFSKKKLGVVGLYLSGMTIVYAGLFVLQLAIVKFKFDFELITKIYTIYFCALLVLGMLAFGCKVLRKKRISFEIVGTKKSLWILGLVLLQGILYIVLINPYFENNALLETTKITLESKTIYQYNAYSGLPTVVGFPLANKLMFLPVLYAYLSMVFGINPAILFNFVVPCVTFISFYLVMFLWVQYLAKEHGLKWEKLFLILLAVIHLGDGFVYSTGFRVLHEGYTGEAVFFGVIFLYLLFEIKNKSYLIALAGVCTFPGLVKYSLITDFFKGLTGFFRLSATYNGMLVLFVIAVIAYVIKHKKIDLHLLNVNLTISLCGYEIWKNYVTGEKNRKRKVANIIVLFCFLILCGNVRLISRDTGLRSNIYGIPKNEYSVLETIAAGDAEDKIRVMACDDINKWICRSDFNIEPIVGYDVLGENAKWYSYETYDEEALKLWQCVQYPTPELEEIIMEYAEEALIDYVVLERITDEVPMRGHEKIKCIFDSPTYLVYSVDK